MKAALEYVISVLVITGFIAAASFPVAWFFSEMTISGRCAVPTVEIVLDCAESRIFANKLRSVLIGLSASVGFVFAILVCNKVRKIENTPK